MTREIILDSDNSVELPCSLQEDWNSAPLKYVTEIDPESVSGSESDDWEIEYVDISAVNSRGEISETDTMPFGEAPSRAQRLVQDGDTIISTVRTYLKAIAHIEDPNPNLVVSTGFGVIRPDESIYPPFIWRVLQADPFVGWIVANSEGVSYPAIKPSRLGELVIPIPPIETQRTICDYIDYKTSSINKLIDKKRELLATLDEKQQSVLDEIQKEAESGDYVKLKYLVDFLPGYAFSSDSFIRNPDDVRLLRGTNVGIGETDWDDTVYWPRDELEDHRKYLLQPGDVVLAMDRPWISDGIRIAQLDESDCPALLVQRVLRIRSKPEINQKYVQMMLESDRFRQYFEPITTGVSVPHISQEQVGEFEIPLPPKSQQQALVSQWKEFQNESNRLKETTERSIELLQEKRQSLITKAVTGQIDLSDWKPPDKHTLVL